MVLSNQNEIFAAFTSKGFLILRPYLHKLNNFVIDLHEFVLFLCVAE